MARSKTMNDLQSARSGGKRWALSLLMAVVAVLGFALPFAAANGAESGESSGSGSGSVYVIPVKNTVESGLASFLDRALTEAEEAEASLVVLKIDTPGGELLSAEEIGIRIRDAKIPTLAYVEGNAASAGAYIALSADRIVMAPGSAIGAAMLVNASGQAVESPKEVSFWSSKMRSAAETNGRNGEIAIGMVNPDLTVEMEEIGRTKEKGEIISLSAEEALKVGFADAVAGSVDEAISWSGLNNWSTVEINPTAAERLASWLTGISTLLLIIGIAGIVIEMIVPGFGVPGIAGIVAFGLFFFGQYIAGFAGMESIVFFILGIVLLVLEMFVPSFGLLGLLGAAGVIAGIVIGAYDTGDALTSLGIAAGVALVVIAIFVYIFRKRGIWNRFILKESLTTEQGFVPNGNRTAWIGKEGVTLSPLRPAGAAEVDGQRIDVVSLGQFIEAGRRIRVTAADGTRIVVTEIE
ncbi:NfeD family protein [Cohnella massiliensis]|uniref:NfeD family protein n=1 Tax=Cohnella massiliensis TaxID=1816691 RepID=UPI001FE7EB60|nr:NfeD family protein [Cohnella massiliensis]